MINQVNWTFKAIVARLSKISKSFRKSFHLICTFLVFFNEFLGAVKKEITLGIMKLVRFLMKLSHETVTIELKNGTQVRNVLRKLGMPIKFYFLHVQF